MAVEIDRDRIAGAIDRLQADVLPALEGWRNDQSRRGASDNEIGNALVALFASIMFSEVTHTLGSEIDQRHYTAVNRMLQGVGEEVAEMLSGRMVHEEAGTA